MAFRKFCDMVIAVFLLILSAPLLIVCIALVALDGEGSPIFFQERVGFKGSPFWMVKIRTMRRGSGGQHENDICVDLNDPRITRFGKILRYYHIDELLQLFNVIRGEMALVGPRPMTVGIVTQRESKRPDYRLRHEVLPGITGIAQLYGSEAMLAGGYARQLALDLAYIANQSVSLDVAIVRATLAKFLGKRPPEFAFFENDKAQLTMFFRESV